MAVCTLLVALAMAACSGSPPNHPPRATAPPGVDRALPKSTYAAQQAVLGAWLAGERQYYAYMDEPAAPLRAKLLAGTTPAELFPNASTYATGPSLQAEYATLKAMKLDLLRGPTTYHLGQPTIAAFTGTSATVASCVTDTGTTTQAGAPGPLTLDGGPGGSRGTSILVRSGGRWKAVSGRSVGVSTC